MTNIEIEKMTLDDIDAVEEIDNLSFPIPWSRASFEQELTNLFATYWVAKIGKKVVGYIGSWMVIDECHIMNVAIHPKYRNLGIASKLIQAMLNNCNQHGISYVLLEVRMQNIPAQKLYEKFGFHTDGIRKNYYKNPDGTYEDAILMTKEF